MLSQLHIAVFDKNPRIFPIVDQLMMATMVSTNIYCHTSLYKFCFVLVDILIAGVLAGELKRLCNLVNENAQHSPVYPEIIINHITSKLQLSSS